MSPARSDGSEESVVLIVDDEERLVEILQAYLQDEGFRVLSAFNGRDAIAIARDARPDIVLLDLNLPLVSGAEAFRAIRSTANVPIIMITSRVDEVDRIVGLELGADDYVPKPFSPREVVARVKAVLRRARPRVDESTARADVIRIGSLEIDLGAHEVFRRGRAVDLTPTEFRILSTLGTHLGRALTRDQILERVSADGDAYDRTLDRHVANLRQKIEDEPARPQLVVTVVGVGYKMIDPTRVAARGAGSL